MRLIHRVDELSSHDTYLVCVFRIVLLIREGLSSLSAIELGRLRLADGEIRDIKFANDEDLMVLWHTNSRLLCSLTVSILANHHDRHGSDFTLPLRHI